MKMLFLLFWSSLCLAQVPEKLALCMTCHGKDGIATQSNWPNLQGQSKNYIIQQLKAYKKNTRVSPLMQPYAAMLDDKDMLALAEYYSQLSSKNTSATKINLLGEGLYKHGDFKKRLPACSACHGPHGLGNDPAKFPKLAQQNKLYIEEQLKAFRAKQRLGDAQSMMQDISSRLDDTDIKALSEYLHNMS